MAKITTSLGDFAFLPFPAQAPMRENLEWKTDLMQSFNGTEKAIQLRNHARQSFNYDIPEGNVSKLRAYLTYYGAMRLKWAVPVWAEVQHLGTVIANTQTILCDTVNYDLRLNGLALLWQSPDLWQVVEIVAMDATSITIDGFTVAFQNAYLLPVRVGRVRDNITRASNGFEGSTSIIFEVEDNLALDATVPAQFLGNDIYLDPTLFNDGLISTALTTRTDRIDYELGLVENRYPWNFNRDLRPRHMLANGPAEVRALRGWLMRRAGRFRRFWEPTYENDLRNASTGTLTNKLRVNPADGYTDWPPNRNHIAVNAGGVWLARTVTGIATPTPGVLELTLDSNLNIQASTIRAISFLGLRRLDTDRVELNWLGNSVLRATVNTVEIQP